MDYKAELTELAANVKEAVDKAKALPDAVVEVTFSSDEIQDYLGWHEGLTDEDKAYIDGGFDSAIPSPNYVLVSRSYDELYEALQAGSAVRVRTTRELLNAALDVMNMQPSPVELVVSYALTRMGFAMNTATGICYFFPNGSYHNADTDPYA